MAQITREQIEAIVAYVAAEVPGECISIWLTGSRARGNARPESDFDVLAVHADARPIPADAKEGPIIYSIGKMPTGEQIDLLLIPPGDWNHHGRFMTDCRT